MEVHMSVENIFKLDDYEFHDILRVFYLSNSSGYERDFST